MPRRAAPGGPAGPAGPGNRRRTAFIAAGSVAAVALLAVGAIVLNPFGSGSSAQQQAELAGSGWQASQSAAAAAAGTHPSARPGSSAPGSKSATTRPGSGPTPGGARTSGKANPSATGSAAATGPSSSSSPSASSAPSPSSTGMADADGLPILYASAGDQAHVCAVIGSAYDSDSVATTVEGVVCADILTAATSGGYTAQAQLELLCQTTTTDADVQCADVIAQGELSNVARGVVASTGDYQCGHSYGACATGRNYVKTGSYSYSGFTMSNCTIERRGGDRYLGPGPWRRRHQDRAAGVRRLGQPEHLQRRRWRQPVHRPQLRLPVTREASLDGGPIYVALC